MKVKLLYDDGGLVEVDGVRVVRVVGKGNIEEEDATSAFSIISQGAYTKGRVL